MLYFLKLFYFEKLMKAQVSLGQMEMEELLLRLVFFTYFSRKVDIVRNTKLKHNKWENNIDDHSYCKGVQRIHTVHGSST